MLNLVVYVYDPHAETFKPLPGMPEDLPQQVLYANEALKMVAAGQPMFSLPLTYSSIKFRLYAVHDTHIDASPAATSGTPGSVM